MIQQKKILGKVKGKPAKEWLTDATWKLVEERRNLKACLDGAVGSVVVRAAWLR